MSPNPITSVTLFVMYQKLLALRTGGSMLPTGKPIYLNPAPVAIIVNKLWKVQVNDNYDGSVCREVPDVGL